MSTVKNKIISLYKASTTENYSKSTHVHVNGVCGC